MGTLGKLIVIAAFDRDEEGELVPAFEPREMQDERRAKQAAFELKDRHAGVVAWVRTADIAMGDYGPPEVLAIYGDVPAMD
ncbi:MAG: hypothetical protein ACYCZY_12135 [Lacisediminihabitans sp.]